MKSTVNEKLDDRANFFPKLMRDTRGSQIYIMFNATHGCVVHETVTDGPRNGQRVLLVSLDQMEDFHGSIVLSNS